MRRDYRVGTWLSMEYICGEIQQAQDPKAYSRVNETIVKDKRKQGNSTIYQMKIFLPVSQTEKGSLLADIRRAYEGMGMVFRFLWGCLAENNEKGKVKLLQTIDFISIAELLKIICRSSVGYMMVSMFVLLFQFVCFNSVLTLITKLIFLQNIL